MLQTKVNVKMPQGLCKKLRMVGIDCVALENGQDHQLCLEHVGRMVVSRGAPAQALAKHLPPGHCLALGSNEVEDQVAEVVAHFNVTVREEDLFSRCVLCNGDSYCPGISICPFPVFFRTTKN